MPEITREEATQELEEALRYDHYPTQAVRTGTLRLALAALEDADKLHDMATRADKHLRDCGVVPGDSCGECAGFADELAGLIDRARGVTPPADPPAPAGA